MVNLEINDHLDSAHNYNGGATTDPSVAVVPEKSLKDARAVATLICVLISPKGEKVFPPVIIGLVVIAIIGLLTTITITLARQDSQNDIQVYYSASAIYGQRGPNKHFLIDPLRNLEVGLGPGTMNRYLNVLPGLETLIYIPPTNLEASYPLTRYLIPERIERWASNPEVHVLASIISPGFSSYLMTFAEGHELVIADQTGEIIVINREGIGNYTRAAVSPEGRYIVIWDESNPEAGFTYYDLQTEEGGQYLDLSAIIGELRSNFDIESVTITDNQKLLITGFKSCFDDSGKLERSGYSVYILSLGSGSLTMEQELSDLESFFPPVTTPNGQWVVYVQTTSPSQSQVVAINTSDSSSTSVDVDGGMGTTVVSATDNGLVIITTPMTSHGITQASSIQMDFD